MTVTDPRTAPPPVTGNRPGRYIRTRGWLPAGLLLALGLVAAAVAVDRPGRGHRPRWRGRRGRGALRHPAAAAARRRRRGHDRSAPAASSCCSPAPTTAPARSPRTATAPCCGPGGGRASGCSRSWPPRCSPPPTAPGSRSAGCSRRRTSGACSTRRRSRSGGPWRPAWCWSAGSPAGSRCSGGPPRRCWSWSMLAVLPPLAAGHSSSDANHDFATAAIWIHVPAALLWVGLLVPVLDRVRRGRAEPVLARYRRARWTLAAVVVASGVVDALALAPSADRRPLRLPAVAAGQDAARPERRPPGGRGGATRRRAPAGREAAGSENCCCCSPRRAPRRPWRCCRRRRSWATRPRSSRRLLGYDLSGPPTALRLLLRLAGRGGVRGAGDRAGRRVPARGAAAASLPAPPGPGRGRPGLARRLRRAAVRDQLRGRPLRRGAVQRPHDLAHAGRARRPAAAGPGRAADPGAGHAARRPGPAARAAGLDRAARLVPARPGAHPPRRGAGDLRRLAVPALLHARLRRGGALPLGRDRDRRLVPGRRLPVHLDRRGRATRCRAGCRTWPGWACCWPRRRSSPSSPRSS